MIDENTRVVIVSAESFYTISNTHHNFKLPVRKMKKLYHVRASKYK